MVFVIMKLRVKPEKHRELVQTIESLLGTAPIKKNCKRLNICQDIADENVFFFIEEWESRSELTTYMSSHSFNTLLGATRILCMPPGLSMTMFSQEPTS